MLSGWKPISQACCWNKRQRIQTWGTPVKSLHDLICENIRLPSPPAIAIKILDTVRKDNFSFRDLARIIESDPALLVKILKVANSSYYGFARKVSNIETAISVLGSQAVRNIALSFVIFSGLKHDENNKFDFDLYWRRAITAAVAGEQIAALTGVRSPDIFVTALLQDIGVLIFNASFPEHYQLTMNENLASKTPLHELEKHCFGYDHQELGGELLCHWRIPDEISVPIRYHHRHEQAPGQYRDQVELLQIADLLSAIYHGNKSVAKIDTVRGRLAGSFDIQGEEVDRLIDDVASQTLEMLSVFDISPGTMQPFSMIMQQANEELSNLNMSYELLVIELRQAREKAEKLAEELHNANVRLYEMAFRDALTGLYNHRFFQEAMDRELDRANRYKHDFSLVIFDIDHFKKVNDTYGHPVGDLVLAEIGRQAQQIVRNSDILARYGGEEFAVILPETDFIGVQTLAERLRSGIESLEITAEGKTIKATISAGFTSYRNGARVYDKGAIIDMADKALYIAKKCGRNRAHAMRFPGT